MLFIFSVEGCCMSDFFRRQAIESQSDIKQLFQSAGKTPGVDRAVVQAVRDDLSKLLMPVTTLNTHRPGNKDTEDAAHVLSSLIHLIEGQLAPVQSANTEEDPEARTSFGV
jgi:hypothetical protein